MKTYLHFTDSLTIRKFFFYSLAFLSTTLFTDAIQSQTKQNPLAKPRVRISQIILQDQSYEKINVQSLQGAKDALNELLTKKIIEKEQIEIRTEFSKPSLSGLEQAADSSFGKSSSDIVIGGYTSSQSLQLALVSERRKKFAMVFGASPEEVKERFKHSISMTPSEFNEANAIASFVVKHLKKNSVAIVFNGSKTPAYGERLRNYLSEAMQKHGVQVRLSIQASLDPEMNKKIMDQIRASAPQIIVCACSLEESKVLIQVSSSMGLRYSILQISRSLDKSLFNGLDDKSIRGHFVSALNLEKIGSNDTNASIEKKYLEASNYFYRLSYEAIWLMGHALAKSPNSLPATITKTLAAIQNQNSPYGDLSFHAGSRSFLRELDILKTIVPANFEFAARIKSKDYIELYPTVPTIQNTSK